MKNILLQGISSHLMTKHPLRYKYHQQATFFTFLIMTLYLIAARDAFIALGFPPEAVFFLLLLSYIGSGVNIPLYSVESTYKIDVKIPVSFFGYSFIVPKFINSKTLVAINFGGAIIPILVSTLLLIKDPMAFPHLLIPLAVTSVLINKGAKLVPGMGVTLPALYAPTISVFVSLISLSITGGVGHLVEVIYITASMGSLIGADLMNLKKIHSLGSPMVSIGGAGTFDGVFMGGVMAIILLGTFFPMVFGL